MKIGRLLRLVWGDGASLYIVGKALGHTQSPTTERYAHLAQDPVRAAAERVAARVAVGIEARTAGGGEVPIREARRTDGQYRSGRTAEPLMH